MLSKKLQKISKSLRTSSRVRLVGVLAVVCIFAVLGWTLLKMTGAATYSVLLEAESGARSGNVAVESSLPGASGGQYVRFGASNTSSNETPTLEVEELVGGLSRPWDIAFLPTGEFIFPQRAGSLSVYRNGSVSKIADMSVVRATGEGGLMGIAVDPQFATNRYIYTCYLSFTPDVRVSRWKLNTAFNGLEDQKDIITGIRASPIGRHSGCRVVFGPDGYLWVGTGDGVYTGEPQNLQGLNGKVLRVDRDGNGAPGNLGNGADARIFNYGHRNIQGIAFFPAPKNGVPGLTSEHGTNLDDEVNELRKGNFGWSNAADGVDEGNMTDKARWPDAIDPIWKSGPTIAPSGMTIVNGAQWKGWNGALAVAILKGSHMMVLRLDDQNKVTKMEKSLNGLYGRLRTVQQGPDGSLYVTTDNGDDDKIIRLTPQ